MTPTLPAVTAAIATRQWVRERRAKNGRQIDPAEVEAFVRDRYDYLHPTEQRYVVECASPAMLKVRWPS